MTESIVERITKPDIIVPDASPLIRLALAGHLDLLHEIGRSVVIVDVVADEVTTDASKPGTRELDQWIVAGLAPGSNTPFQIDPTETGQAITLAHKADPGFRAPNVGEAAIVGWLATTVQGTDAATVVLYENGRVPGIVANQNLDADIDVVTTRAFLDIAEPRGLIASAGEVWRSMIAVAPIANPRVQAFTQRRPPPSRRDDDLGR